MCPVRFPASLGTRRWPSCLHLVEKTRRGVACARELAPELRQLVVAGGVACNQVVRSNLQALADKESLELVLPPPRWCTDNGVMVAWAGIERLALGWAEPPPPPLPQGGRRGGADWRQALRVLQVQRYQGGSAQPGSGQHKLNIRAGA
ncbi:putative tRNA threonylcarbamoyladenosine biosynthesis protein osgepl1 [Tetrabaena socialis]|uniref:Putative tRNA threonylcarbamoyladenosine biosynthesis protein osgepl1 n=1 Tax=Tetrabaena socialis TaxID=47790 RepID=A0A2J8A4Q2_9CHLO|nr:putative tRNA threonylcarbamoyladenosine biosynthesis protein osgepl1 [Tetrabaena socialis]|eukprot:PNH07504.1 putative tRNA threonylcarbamoyladenosine biosynthesis protein osgepl1 [Tetrabaena socialis]